MGILGVFIRQILMICGHFDDGTTSLRIHPLKIVLAPTPTIFENDGLDCK